MTPTGPRLTDCRSPHHDAVRSSHRNGRRAPSARPSGRAALRARARPNHPITPEGLGKTHGPCPSPPEDRSPPGEPIRRRPARPQSESRRPRPSQPAGRMIRPDGPRHAAPASDLCHAEGMDSSPGHEPPVSPGTDTACRGCFGGPEDGQGCSASARFAVTRYRDVALTVCPGHLGPSLLLARNLLWPPEIRLIR
jgi:hypothetical protein